jgi:hypothetical protein
MRTVGLRPLTGDGRHRQQICPSKVAPVQGMEEMTGSELDTSFSPLNFLTNSLTLEALPLKTTLSKQWW